MNISVTQPEVVIVQPTEQKVSKRDLKCLAENIYHEARGEGFIGMEAVAHVTLNRVATKGFPDTICDVVYQPNQFSWTRLRNQLGIYEKAAYEQSVAIAKYALNTSEDITGGALFFHTVQLKRPRWARSYEESIVINNHIFYKGK
jgi:spore germination cell wall hydrolase CwlJ-like protein